MSGLNACATIKRLHSAEGSGRKWSPATAAKWLHRKWCNARFRALRPQLHCPPCFGTLMHTKWYLHIHVHTPTHARPHTHIHLPTLTQTHMVTVSSETQHVLGKACRNTDFTTLRLDSVVRSAGKRALERKASLVEGALHPHMFESQRKQVSQ